MIIRLTGSDPASHEGNNKPPTTEQSRRRAHGTLLAGEADRGLARFHFHLYNTLQHAGTPHTNPTNAVL